MKTFTAYVEQDTETGLYVVIVPGISGAHTQGSTRPLIREILREIEITPELFVKELSNI